MPPLAVVSEVIEALDVSGELADCYRLHLRGSCTKRRRSAKRGSRDRLPLSPCTSRWRKADRGWDVDPFSSHCTSWNSWGLFPTS